MTISHFHTDAVVGGGGGFNIILWAMQHLPVRKPASFDNGRQSVQYQAFVQFVEEIGLNIFGLDGSSHGFRRTRTSDCLQSIGKRCFLAHALIMFSTTTLFLISSVRISFLSISFLVLQVLLFCSSMIVNSSPKSLFSCPHRLVILCRCLFGG